MEAPTAASAPPWPRWVEAAGVVGFWALVMGTALVYRAFDGTPFSFHTVAITLVEFGPWLLLTPGILWLARRFPLTRRRWAPHLLLHVAVAVTVAFPLGVLQSVAIHALGAPPSVGRSADGPMLLDGGPPRLDPFDGPPGGGPGGPPDGGGPGGPGMGPDGERGPHIFRLSYQLLIYLVVLGAGFARAFALQALARQAETAAMAARAQRLDAQLTEAQLHALRAQLHPHFLFNALNAVSSLIASDPPRAQEVLARVSALLRRVVDAPPGHEVPLDEEIEVLRDYVEVQLVRFEGDLEVDITVAPDAANACIPTLLLQPLVENAIEHGAGRTLDSMGRVTVTARREGATDGEGRLVVTVHDNGPGLEGRDPVRRDGRPGGVGVSNTRARLETLYGPAATLTLGPAPSGGFQAVVALPYRSVRPAHA